MNSSVSSTEFTKLKFFTKVKLASQGMKQLDIFLPNADTNTYPMLILKIFCKFSLFRLKSHFLAHLFSMRMYMECIGC